ncbi:glycosyltransferase [Desulforhopalus vacuolatus]|uniref:CgeB family protein n=1 Tax=Desulforhopalus vacuolatus TaxID=40414 RepID=UPI001963888E|nr:glycosyltransferase [Desulforhopalus vacuolatus]MBM9520473.1 glycosyltransferase [Desulforhopalus vacuolatus]
MKKLNILYIGWLSAGSTSLQRMNAFKRLGHDVIGVSCDPFIPRPFFINCILHRIFRLGLAVKRINLGQLNRKIISVAKEKTFDILWIDKGLSVDRFTLISIKASAPKIKICGYSPDVMSERDNQSKRFLEHLDLYDHFFTTKSFDVENLKTLGMKSVSFVENSFDVSVHRPISSDNPAFKNKVGFIGSYEDFREKSMLYLAENGVPLTVFGGSTKGWSVAFRSHPNVRFYDYGLYGDEYAEALSNFAINLCFLKHWNGDQVTTRSIEIPACKGFMLTERTDAHLALFVEGEDCDFFEDNDELLNKVQAYLIDETKRIKLSRNAYYKVLKYHELCIRMRRCLLTISEISNQSFSG